MATEDQSKKILARNKKARHDFFIQDTFEAGIALQGTEVKSARNQRMNLTDSYARVDKGEIWLVGLHISPYKQGNLFNHDPIRTRKLLMHKREIERLRKQKEEKGMTIIPLSVYLKNGRIKVEIALAKGKHLYDKRQDKAARDASREMARAMKRAVRE